MENEDSHNQEIEEHAEDETGETSQEDRTGLSDRAISLASVRQTLIYKLNTGNRYGIILSRCNLLELEVISQRSVYS